MKADSIKAKITLAIALDLVPTSADISVLIASPPATNPTIKNATTLARVTAKPNVRAPASNLPMIGQNLFLVKAQEDLSASIPRLF